MRLALTVLLAALPVLAWASDGACPPLPGERRGGMPLKLLGAAPRRVEPGRQNPVEFTLRGPHGREARLGIEWRVRERDAVVSQSELVPLTSDLEGTWRASAVLDLRARFDATRIEARVVALRGLERLSDIESVELGVVRPRD